MGTASAQNVAKIGSTEYATLQAAFTEAQSGQTIELLANIEDAGNINLPAGVTLDGDNHNISGNSAIHINAAGGTVKNVNFENIHNDAVVGANQYGLSESAVGTQTAIEASGLTGAVTITGCTFDNCDWDAIRVVPSKDAGEDLAITITNNIFKHTNTAAHQLRYIHLEYVQGTSNVGRVSALLNITDNQFLDQNQSGRTITAILAAKMDASDDSNLSGNYYSNRDAIEVAMSYNVSIEDFYPMRSQADVDVDDVQIETAQIGTTKYATLAAAFEAANASSATSTIKLLRDVVVNETYTVNNTSGKWIALENGTHALTANVPLVNASTQFNFNGGSGLVTVPAEGELFIIQEGAKLLFQSGIFNSNSVEKYLDNSAHYLKDNGNGTYTITSWSEAEAIAAGRVITVSWSGNKYFKTLKEVVDYAKANAKTSASPKLLADVTSAEEIETTLTTLTINPNGYTFTGAVNSTGKVALSTTSTTGTVNFTKLIATELANNKSTAAIIIEDGNVNALTTGQGVTPNLTIKGGTYGFDPTAYVAEGYESVDNGNGTFTVQPEATMVAQIGETKYETLAEAVVAVPADGTETTITMIADEMITTNTGVVIPATKNIVLDLAGHSILGIARQSDTSYVISNSGTLTINDSSVEGTGAIIGNALLADETSIPGYASNTIRNYGHLTVNNCFIESKGTGYASYAIDNDAENAQWQTTPDHTVSLTINGGKFRSNTSQTIRMYLDTEGVYENVISINNADMGSFWVQDNNKSQAAKGTLNIDSSSFIYSVGIGYYGQTQNLKVTATNNSFTSLHYTLWDPTEGTNSLTLQNNKFSGTFNSLVEFPVLTDGLYGSTSSSNKYYGGTQYLANSVADGYELIANTDPATKDTYPYMVAPIKVRLVHDDVEVTTNPEATAEEQEAANAAVEELGSNESVTADDATNVADLEDVHTLVIKVVSATVETKTEGEASATIKQVTYDVQPYKNDEKVNVTTQPLTFRLPVPQSFKGSIVKVNHEHNDVTTSTYETVQGEGANKYVKLASDKFSEWTLEDIDPLTVAMIGDAQYTTLADAVAAATNGQTITMVADAKAGAMVEISGKNITLDLNGKTISPVEGTKISGGLIGVHNGAGLTIDDSSEEKNGTITSGSDGKVYAAVQVTVKGDAATSPATLVVNNGNLTGYYYGIAGNGNRHNTVVTINGGTITGQEGTAIYHPQDGTLNINDGTLTGKETAVELRAGTINVTGGTLTSTATEFAEQGNGSGTTIVGAALAVSQHATNKDIAVNISGGEFNGIKAVYEKDYQDTNCDNIAMNITDGTFNGSVASQNVEKFVSGGSFQEIIPAEYCALGFVPVTTPDAHGMYTVEESDTELTVYVGDSTPHTMRILEFLDTQDTHSNAMAVVASTHAAEVEGLTNVIVDYPVGHGGHYYECENFVLADIKNWYSPVDFIALSGSYSRGLSAGLTTICVPFNVSENSDFTKYIYHSSNEAGTTAYFNHIDNVDAGVAFLADVHAGTTWNCSFDNTHIYANTNVEGGALRGTYQKTTVSDCYKVNQEGTGLQYYSSEITYPFRAYFILTNENPFYGSQTRSLRIAFDELEEGTTGISGVGNDANSNVIYNAQGLRMNKIQNGLNIVNGKKILK